MVQIAAFMVICYLGFKFLRWVWPHRGSVAHRTFQLLKIIGIGLLLIGFGAYLYAQHQIPTPGLLVVVFAVAGWMYRGGRKAKEQPASTVDAQQFKDFMGMGN